ncbi:MAG: TonB-dependent receptor [Flavobacteriaceae bacterium]|jgi:outer membrane cobalamin receptor|nr:TonB-dependent receptor [Flavobacteriaceae bacterium]
MLFRFSIIKKQFATGLFCFSVLASAQERSDSLRQLKEIVVIARPFQKIIPSQKLTGVQLEKLNSHSVADALRYFAGVQIKDYGGMGGLKTVNVRNMGSTHVGVFYDGIQLGNAQNGVVDLGKFSLDDLDEISLYNGQKSEIFQSAKDFASASAIYIKAKKPKFADNKKTNLLVRYKAGSIQLINPSVRLEQKINDRWNFSLSSEYIRSDGKYKFRYKRNNVDGTVAYDTVATRWNSDIEALRIESGLYGTVQNGHWETKLYYYGSDRGLPGAIVKNVWYNGERQGDKNFFAQAGFTKDITSKYKFQIKGKYAYDYTHYLSRDSVLFMGSSVTKKMQFDNSYYQQEFYLTAVNAYSISPIWDVSLSADFQYNKLNATMRGVGTLFTYPQRYSLWSSLASSLDLGKLKAQTSILGTFVTEEVRNNAGSPDKSELAPAVFIGYRPFEKHDFNIRAFAKRIFRMPTFNDLYYTQIGNSVLKPEYTNQYNLGFSYNKSFTLSFLNAVAVQLDAYYMDVTDKIIAAPTGSNFRWMMTNMGKVEGKGLDATLGVKGHIGTVELNTNLTYSYSKVQDFTKINGVKMSSHGDQIPYTPWHSGSVILNISRNTWFLNYSFMYVGERYDGAVNNIARNHIEPWYTHDISIQKEWTYKKYKIKGSVEMNNALDQYYDVVLNYPMPGRNFRFVLNISL